MKIILGIAVGMVVVLASVLPFGAHADPGGTLSAWGSNITGAVNGASGLSSLTSLSASYGDAAGVKGDGTVVAWGDATSGQTTVPAQLAGVTAVSVGLGFDLALKADGTVTAWGSPGTPQAAPPPGLSGVVAVAAGQGFALALKTNGTVVAWGATNNPATSVPAGLSTVTAIAAGSNYALALKGDGTVTAWGATSNPATSVPAGLSTVTAIAAGADHALALHVNGAVTAWGGNSAGQADVPLNLSGVRAVAAGQGFSLALIQPFTITTATLPPAVVGAPLTTTAFGTADGQTPFTWQAAPAGALTPGLTLSSTGILSGTPTAPGTYNFTVRSTDSTPGGGQTASRTYALTVLSPLQATFTQPLPPATIGLPYNAATTGAPTGGVPPYKWTVTQGALPPGLTLGPGTGQITGTPTAVGTSSFTVAVSDSSLAAQQIHPLTQQMSVTVQRVSTATVLIATPNPSTQGQTVALTATVTASAGGSATGSVTFADGAITLGSAALDTTVLPAKATLTTGSLAVGVHALIATYTGDTTHLGSTSTTVSQTVQSKPAAPAVTLHPSVAVSAPGQVVTVTGTGLPARQTVQVRLAGLPQSVTVTIAADGSLTARIVLWQHSAPGQHQIQVVTTASLGTVLVTTPFLVQPSPLEPPNFVNRG